jgi:hypothetical protein
MADVNLVKSKYTDSDVTSLGELAAADNAKIPGSLQVVGATTLDTDLTVANGGTGASTLTDHGVLVGSATDPITPLAVGTNGQVLVGSTGADPVFATITDGEGIDTTLGAGTLTIACETTSTTNPGVIELATQAEVLAGTDTSRAVVPIDLWAKTAIDVNPKAFAQGVNMTAATSGSTGITVADDADIDFGTGNFTLVWKGSLPDWTPSTNAWLIIKGATVGYKLYNTLLNKIGWYIRGVDGVAIDSATSSGAGFVNGAVHEIVAVVTRETALVAGSILTYIDGVLFDTTAITVGSSGDLSNGDALYVSGQSAIRTASTSQSAYTFNRALTAAEVLSLYRNGIAEADKWGSQTSIITGNDSTFAGASNWANTGAINSYDETTGGVLTITANAAGQYCDLPVANATTVAGKKYRLVYDAATLTSTWTIKDFTRTQTIDTIDAAATGITTEFTATTTGGLSIVSVADNSSVVLDNFLLYEIGATLALEGEGIQPNPGQWLDSSSNKLHAWQPATGSSLTRYKKTFEIRGINTWAGTHEAQSVTMLTDASRAMLPANCYITEIIGVVAGATIEDIIVGDGSDTDHWVAATTGLAAGTTAFTIANHISDGTNFEMVVDPDANFTGTIEWTIRGFIID